MIIAVCSVARRIHSHDRSGHTSDFLRIDHAAVCHTEYMQRLFRHPVAEREHFTVHLDLQHNVFFIPFDFRKNLPMCRTLKSRKIRRAVEIRCIKDESKYLSVVCFCPLQMHLMVHRLHNRQSGALLSLRQK